MVLERLPSFIHNLRFSDSGLIQESGNTFVPAYIASQLGFSESGRKTLEKFYFRLKTEANVVALCPFEACSEFFNKQKLESLRLVEEERNYLQEFNKLVGLINYGELMPRSKFMVAILDGGHQVDDGVASEIAYFAATYGGQNQDSRPIIGIRSDIRSAENVAAVINPAVRYFLDYGTYNGYLCQGSKAYDDAIERSRKLADIIILSSSA